MKKGTSKTLLAKPDFLLNRYFLLILLIIFFCGHIAAQPKLKIVGKDKFSFGKVYGGSRPVHKMKILNEGTSPLIIKNMSAACDCSLLKISSNTIPPKKTATLSITLVTDGMDGIVNKSVSIISNESPQPIKVIYFDAEVVNLIGTDPRILILSDSECVKGVYKILHITNRSKKKLKIISIQDSTGLTNNRFRTTSLPPNQSTDAFIHGMAVGSTSRHGIIKITTDSRLQPIIRVRYVIQGTKN